jgi:hypothetical protein
VDGDVVVGTLYVDAGRIPAPLQKLHQKPTVFHLEFLLLQPTVEGGTTQDFSFLPARLVRQKYFVLPQYERLWDREDDLSLFFLLYCLLQQKVFRWGKRRTRRKKMGMAGGRVQLPTRPPALPNQVPGAEGIPSRRVW